MKIIIGSGCVGLSIAYKLLKKSKKGFPNSDAVMERGVLLPLHHGMTNEMFERLHVTIETFIKNKTENI